MSEQPAPPPAPGPRRVRVHHLRQMKEQARPITMLTAYDALVAAVFDEAGTDVLLVGDSYGTVVLGHPTTVGVRLEELLPVVRAVAGAVRRPLVVADLPFGSYGADPAQAMATAVRLMKEGEAHAVKLEGGRPVAASVRALVDAGVPVMGHLGFTPQSEHALGGFRVQGRGEEAAAAMLADALALQEAGAFAIVLEMVPPSTAQRLTRELAIPTIGIGAGTGCDGQVLVWTDMAGLTPRAPRLAKAYADLRGTLLDAARAYGEEVRSGAFPGPEQTYPEQATSPG
ncbi:MAG: 3-methyl-2-oxobutanoate hydroxymethyltransferase [uncultured Quadrisphaera sp.]|uniref:3-methyl-2-oxobutanoate hydroxymethyltransferase n=1 Tax=uncultured Quadrisphaera sp. TaxID=904978 RepID=A0A6J4PV10_9ACTN|nr:MAG: 3-methyl-2-oxobutanoate hydroxymethyltransferase [uncultured Quadrisphaera sp.]